MSGATTSRPAPDWGRRLSDLLGLALLLLLLGDGLRPAGAETAPPDSAHRPTPRAVLWRSAVLPGWGQYCNGRPVKALGFGAAAAGFAGAAVVAARAVDQARTEAERQDRASRRNTRFLYLFATATLAALDAYVDAQLSGFEAVAWTKDSGGLMGVRLVRTWGETSSAGHRWH